MDMKTAHANSVSPSTECKPTEEFHKNVRILTMLHKNKQQ